MVLSLVCTAQFLHSHGISPRLSFLIVLRFCELGEDSAQRPQWVWASVRFCLSEHRAAKVYHFQNSYGGGHEPHLGTNIKTAHGSYYLLCLTPRTSEDNQTLGRFWL